MTPDLIILSLERAWELHQGEGQMERAVRIGILSLAAELAAVLPNPLDGIHVLTWVQEHRVNMEETA